MLGTVLAVAVVVLAGCGGDAPDTLPASAEDDSTSGTVADSDVGVGEQADDASAAEPDTTARVSVVSVVDEQTLVLAIDDLWCGERESTVVETAERVTITVEALDEAAGASDVEQCPPAGDSVEVALDAPLGDRVVAVAVPVERFVAESQAPCLHLPGAQWCRELLMTNGGEELGIGAPAYEPAPVGMEIGGDNTVGLADGSELQIAGDTIEAPYVTQRRFLEGHGPELWGSVRVHNVKRDLDEAARLDRSVSGFPAYWVTPADRPFDAARVVAIEAGPWSIDVEVSSTDPRRRQRALEDLLGALVIDRRPGSMPLVQTDRHLLSVEAETMISDGKELALRFVYAPNCDAEANDRCLPDTGLLTPGDTAVHLTAGVVELFPTPGTPLGWRELILPDGVGVTVVDPGPHGDLVSCGGGPGVDPGLLPSGVSLDVARDSVQVFTGLGKWAERLQPGVVTAYVGTRDAPMTVATYRRDAAGTWSVEAVTSCS